MLWANISLQAKPLEVNSYDITAAMIETGGAPILVVAAYDPRNAFITAGEQEIEITTKIQLIKDTIDRGRNQEGQDIHILICANFN